MSNQMKVLLLCVGVLAFVVYRNKQQKKELDQEILRISNLDIDRKKLELMKLQTLLDKYKTNHILHFLVSIFSLSIWIIPWIIIARSNSGYRDKIEQLMKAI